MDTNYDVIVCGGGIAGIAAALASARMGAKTCLIEKEYALGGLASLGLIVIYLPLCDGAGVQMSYGISEELLKVSLKYGPGQIPTPWTEENASTEERAEKRYLVEYSPASLMIGAEELLLKNGVKLLYDSRLSGMNRSGGKINSIIIETKRGPMEMTAKAFIDGTGDADLCFYAKERTEDDATNRRTGWYYSYDGKDLVLRQQTDPIYSEIPKDSRLYSGTDVEDITQHCIDGRRMIIDHINKLRENGNYEAYPLMIPTFPGLRMTRRLIGTFEFSEDDHEDVWFSDAIGMIGNWKERNKRYSIPYSCITGVENSNLYAVGRCVSADKSGWDLTRVIPTCAVTGEAAGTAAAIQAIHGHRPQAHRVQRALRDNGVVLDPRYFGMEFGQTR